MLCRSPSFCVPTVACHGSYQVAQPFGNSLPAMQMANNQERLFFMRLELELLLRGVAQRVQVRLHRLHHRGRAAPHDLHPGTWSWQMFSANMDPE